MSALHLDRRRARSATFSLPASKSLANRALIIEAVCAEEVTLGNLSDAQDTVTLRRLLGEVESGATLDCGPAGTTFRFLTAYLCTRPGTQILTGSARMLQRPIGALVDALRELGAKVEYVEEEGYPPLRIGAGALGTRRRTVELPGDISSQYLSALMLVGPSLERGMRINWTGELVSRPYVTMTAALMRRFGAGVTISGSSIDISPQPYSGGAYEVESDWSAASYAAAWIATAPVGTSWFCPGLHDDSLQGDRQLTRWISDWGVDSAFAEDGVRFTRVRDEHPASWECDFETSPDLAQTFAALCGVTGTTGLFTGLQTLAIKETDRIAALKAELGKAGVFVSKLPARFSPQSNRKYYTVEGEAQWSGTLALATYHDHRMAMALSLLAVRGAVTFDDDAVVAKSFPDFWRALEAATAEAA